MNRKAWDLTKVGVTTATVTTAVLLPFALQRATPPRPIGARETPKLTITDYTPQELTDSMGIAINDKNEVIGTAFGESGEVRAFVVRGKKGELLPLPKGAPFSAASAINAKGEIVGIVGDQDHVRGVAWRGNQVGVLTSGKRETVATAISNNTVAAGVAFDSQQSRMNLLNAPSTMLTTLRGDFKTAVGSLLSAPQDAGFAGMLWSKPGDGKSIGEFVPQAGNGAGVLVGITVGKNGPVPAAFKNGKIGTLPLPKGAEFAVPFSANEKEIFVGASATESGVQPTGWANGKTGFLPVPGGRQGIATGINDSNQVAGMIEAEDGSAHAAVWTEGKVIDLNDVVDKRDGWVLVQARGINNKGYVVGSAIKNGHLGAFVIGPVK